MQVVILVGGKGTRLGDLTASKPKPMVDVGGRPFLWFLIDQLSRHGFNDILLICGHFADQIFLEFNGINIGVSKIVCIAEPVPMGTGGALKFATEFLDDEFLLLNGDTFFDINYLDLITFYVSNPWVCKIALRYLPDTSRYGTVLLEDSKIIAFSEKTHNSTGYINAGIYFFRKVVLNYIVELPCSLESDVLPLIAADGLIFGRYYDKYFIDIGIPEDYNLACSILPNLNRPAIFFDRDGVLNFDNGYTYKIENFTWIESAIESIKLFNDAGWLVFVVSNQSGVARGYYDVSDVNYLHDWMQFQLILNGAHIDSFYYCPHHPDGVIPKFSIICDCRKPNPGLIISAFSNWPMIDVSKSWLIGDKPTDIQAAKLSGINSFLFTDNNLLSISNRILNSNGDVI
jgi:D,D-heptose 1,7-bisphosphate phosphatase